MAYRLPSKMDGTYYDLMRFSLVEADATDREIDSVAAGMVVMVVEESAGWREFHYEQFELIQDHLCRTAMRVTIRARKQDGFESMILVEFPERERVH